MYVLMVDLYTELKGEATNCDALSYVYLSVTSWHLDCTTVCDFPRQRWLVEWTLLNSMHLKSASYTMFFACIARNAYCNCLQRQRYVEVWVIPPLLTSFVTLWLGTRTSPLGICALDTRVFVVATFSAGRCSCFSQLMCAAGVFYALRAIFTINYKPLSLCI